VADRGESANKAIPRQIHAITEKLGMAAVSRKRCRLLAASGP